MAGAGNGYFDRLCCRLLDEGCSPAEARQAVFDAYLDGKPKAWGQLKPTRADRDRWFWTSELVGECGPADWGGETGILALARYLSQAKVLVDGFVEVLARAAPPALVMAIRRSRLVLTPDSPHLPALWAASALSPIVDEALRVHDVLVAAHCQRQVELARCQAALEDATAFDLLALASLHAYQHLVPHSMMGKSSVEAHGGRLDVHWDAINDLLTWKLETAPLETLKLDDERMGRSLKRFLSPLLSPEREPPTELLGRMQAFAALLAAQIELNEFMSRSVDAHCFDGSVVDFWAHDMLAEAERLQKGGPGLAPRLIERPYLKFGQQLVQLPWVAALQNNGTAAINNLRRLAARRDETAQETRRIEGRLAELLLGRGFRVLLTWQPPAERRDAGEVDVIAACDGHLFILEIKSTFIRRSMQEAWLHTSTPLRKAGRQLQRKADAVGWALGTDETFRCALGLAHSGTGRARSRVDRGHVDRVRPRAVQWFPQGVAGRGDHRPARRSMPAGRSGGTGVRAGACRSDTGR